MGAAIARHLWGWRDWGGQKTLQCGFVTCVLVAARRACYQAAQTVDDSKHCISKLRCRPARAGSQLDKKVFEPVGEPAHAHHADHACRPLHRVGLSEDGVDRRLIVRRGLEGEQPGGDSLEVAFGLLHEQRSELVF
jgi:hypothetical protein